MVKEIIVGFAYLQRTYSSYYTKGPYEKGFFDWWKAYVWSVTETVENKENFVSIYTMKKFGFYFIVLYGKDDERFGVSWYPMMWKMNSSKTILGKTPWVLVLRDGTNT